MSQELTRNQRLDRLPVTGKHRRLLLGSGIGWALDAMDVGLISFIMAALPVHWGLTPTQTSWLGSVGFVGMALGAWLGLGLGLGPRGMWMGLIAGLSVAAVLLGGRFLWRSARLAPEGPVTSGAYRRAPEG